MKIFKCLLLFALIWGIYSCKDKSRSVDLKLEKLKYAQGFTITEENGYKLITIINPWQGADNVK